jgi:hypothetical protein
MTDLCSCGCGYPVSLDRAQADVHAAIDVFTHYKEQTMTTFTDTDVRVRHVKTAAEGLRRDGAMTLHDFDTRGPWSFVEFDDGLACWVRDEDLVIDRTIGVAASPFLDRSITELKEDGSVILSDGGDRNLLMVVVSEDGLELWHYPFPDQHDGEWVQFGTVGFDRSLVSFVAATTDLRTDKEVLDRIADLLASGMGPEHDHQWPGASGMEDIARMVEATGRDVDTPRRGVVWEDH